MGTFSSAVCSHSKKAVRRVLQSTALCAILGLKRATPDYDRVTVTDVTAQKLSIHVDCEAPHVPKSECLPTSSAVMISSWADPRVLLIACTRQTCSREMPAAFAAATPLLERASVARAQCTRYAPVMVAATESKGPVSAVRDFLQGIRRVAGLASDDGVDMFDVERGGLFEEDDRPPEVLVVGATGETGRIIVRKLLLRGYRVRVLVRDLFSSTLDLLGTGVSFVKGNLDDFDSLLEATGDVDKVVCAVGVRGGDEAGDVEFKGVGNLIRAFHDSRVQFYGRGEATKLVLFNFGAQSDLAKWKRVVKEVGDEGARPARVNFMETTNGRVAFMGQVFSKYSGVAEVRTVPARVNLRGFSGIVLRCIGDGKAYRVVLRTAAGVKAGVEYVGRFKTRLNKWESVRIPLSAFVARGIEDRMRSKGAPELDRGDVRQIALQYSKPTVSPEKDDGRFYLGVDYMKAYRTQEQPDFVLVSCASVTARDFSELDDSGLRSVAKDDLIAWKYMAENRLRQSGLTYCIVRPGAFTDQPGGSKAIMLEQDGDVSGAISRADLAEICVKSLLDPRACNVTFDAFESMYAPTARTPSQDVSSMLGRLRPNT